VLPDGISDRHIKISVTMRDRQVIEGCEEGLRGFDRLQEFAPALCLLLGELPELEDDVLSVGTILSIGASKAVRAVGLAFIVADAPMEVKGL